MKNYFQAVLMGTLLLVSAGCTTLQTLDLTYSPKYNSPPISRPIKIAVLPFEDNTWNGQENSFWVGQAPVLGTKLLGPTSISYLVTQGVKKEMGALGFQLSPDEIYTIQINRNDISTLLRRVPHLQVDFLVGGVVSHFFVQQVVRFIAEVEIEAFLVQPPHGNIVWNKKIGYREVRIPFSSENFTSQSQAILNNLLEKTLRDLFRNSDFELYALKEKK